MWRMNEWIRDTLPRGVGFPAAVCLSVGIWCWIEARAAASTASSHGALVLQIEQVHADALRLRQLRAAPRLATDRLRPNDELLGEIRGAIEAARIPVAKWIANDPAPPVRLPRSPYKRIVVRLSFTELSLRQLAEFAYHLTEVNSAIDVSQIRLSSPRGSETHTWNVECGLSYLIYSPYKRSR